VNWGRNLVGKLVGKVVGKLVGKLDKMSKEGKLSPTETTVSQARC